MNFSVWSILESRAWAKRHCSVESLKQTLRREWDRLSPDDLWRIAENFAKRSALYIRAKGGHVGHDVAVSVRCSYLFIVHRNCQPLSSYNKKASTRSISAQPSTIVYSQT